MFALRSVRGCQRRGAACGAARAGGAAGLAAGKVVRTVPASSGWAAAEPSVQPSGGSRLWQRRRPPEGSAYRAGLPRSRGARRSGRFGAAAPLEQGGRPGGRGSRLHGAGSRRGAARPGAGLDVLPAVGLVPLGQRGVRGLPGQVLGSAAAVPCPLRSGPSEALGTAPRARAAVRLELGKEGIEGYGVRCQRTHRTV